MPALLGHLRGWVEAAHPFPLAAVLLLTALIAIASTGGAGLDEGRFALVLLAMLLSQLAIGWTNDYTDRDADRRSQPSKPLASGRLDPTLMPVAIAAVLLGSLVIGVLLGALPLLFLVVGTAAGLSYDLWIKQTRWSWAPYVVAFAVLPLYVWTALDLYRSEFLLGYVVALLLAPAAHVANVLPDIEADIASGRRNVTVIWGRGRSLRVLAACLFAPVLLGALTLPFIEYDRAILLGVLLAYLALLSLAAAIYARRLDRMAFRVVVAAAVLFVGGWIAAV